MQLRSGLFFDAAPSEELNFVYDTKAKLLAELDQSKASQRAYFYGSGTSGDPSLDGTAGPVACRDVSTNATYAYVYDGSANVRSLVALPSLEISAKYEYGPFGETLKSSGVTGNINPFCFSGHYADHETGLLYAKRRYHVPKIGRWLSRDPIYEMGGGKFVCVRRKRSNSTCRF
jgi:RHS repeat-associated protein